MSRVEGEASPENLTWQHWEGVGCLQVALIPRLKQWWEGLPVRGRRRVGAWPFPLPPCPALGLTSWEEAAPAGDPARSSGRRAGPVFRQAHGLDSGAQVHWAAQLEQCQVATGPVLSVVGGQQHPLHGHREGAGRGLAQTKRPEAHAVPRYWRLPA